MKYSTSHIIRGGLKVGVFVMMAVLGIQDVSAEAPEPNSIHAWLDSSIRNVTNYEVDVYINEFPSGVDPYWLYFWALQTAFSNDGGVAHGGLQWAAGGKKANWGGYGLVTDTASIIDYPWQPGKWYRYRVTRGQHNVLGWEYGFWILNYDTGVEKKIGSVVSRGEFIEGAVIWTETGYGVKCDSSPVRVTWRSPRFTTATSSKGTWYVPESAFMDYNDTCGEQGTSTNQYIKTEKPFLVVQETTAKRMVPNGTRTAITQVGAIENLIVVTKQGTGTGKVQSNVTGISCGTDCWNTYSYDKLVRLDAIALPGSRFSKWNGCSYVYNNFQCYARTRGVTLVIPTFTKS